MSGVFGFPDPVDEVSARIVAAGVLGMATATVAADEPRLLIPLAYGFGARVLTGPRWSPLGLLATKVVRPRVPARPKLVPGPPKRLAQGMGFAMSGGALVLHYGLGRTRAAYGVLGLLIGAATLEAVFGYCLACRAFPLLIRAGLVPPEACERCANIWATSRPAA